MRIQRRDAETQSQFWFCFLRLCAFTLSFFFAVLADAQNHNVLLITIDTLRADHLSCNGLTKVKTPNIDSLAKRGINFTRVRTPVPLTLPSHTSILTGLYPPSHGVRDNGTFRLSDSATTLGEVFLKHGYDTAAFVGSFVLDHRFGLAQGFEVYDDNMSTDPDQLENPEAERSADSVLKTFAKWYLHRARARPFFAWVHFYDPHAPYHAPAAFSKQYPADPYAAEVAYSDSVVGKLLKTIPPNTLIALIGDHGEGLGEHRESTHSILIYNSTLHVPFILSAPDLLPAGKTVPALCRTIDVAPTLLDLLHIPEKIGEGVSLRPWIEQQKPSMELTSYSESLYPKLNLGWSELRGIEQGHFHYIAGPDPELYDLSKDPGEISNVFSQNRSLAEKLQALIPAGHATPQNPSIDPETAAKLRSLGYISGSPPVSSNIDPKSKMGIWNQMQTAMAEFHQAKYAAAISGLQKVKAADSGLYLVYEYLSSAYLKQGNLDLAEQAVKDARAHGAQTAALMFNLGVIQFKKKNLGAADAAFRSAVELDPLQVPALYYLGLIRRLQKQMEPALQYFQKSLQINPRYVLAWNGAGMCYSAIGNGEKALEAFLQVVKLEPRSPQGYFNLAVQMEQMKRNAEAVAQYKKFLQLTPRGEAREQRIRASEAIDRLTPNAETQRRREKKF